VIQHIDLQAILRRSVSEVYRDLVTRPTGKAVRTSIEAELRLAADAPVLAVVDFTGVGCVDHSCADEIVAKLLLAGYGYFVFRGLSDTHRDALEPVLEHHGLIIAVDEGDGRLDLFGAAPEEARAAFQAIQHGGDRVTPATVAAELGWSESHAAQVLDALVERRVARRNADGYTASLAA